MSKIKKLLIILAAIAAAAVYLYFTDFRLIKDIAGYRVPSLEKPPAQSNSGSASSDFKFLSLPDGFSIKAFAEKLEDPRVIAFDPAGNMVVSETSAGKVILLKDGNKDGIADETKVLLENLNKPHGLAFYNNGKSDFLYVAETNKVSRYLYDGKNSAILSKTVEDITDLPADGEHFTRTIAIGKNLLKEPIISGPMGAATMSPIKLYISVGSSCNACIENTWKRAAMLESDPEGTFTAQFASGLRNAVFFVFHPKTGEIWATEMGRDYLGDDLPPDEVDIIRFGKSYGWPYCYGDKVRDLKFIDPIPQGNSWVITNDCSKTESPVVKISAHSAPLGLAFVTNKKWPAEWQNNLLVAYHGSSNRTTPVGYKIARFIVDEKGNVSGSADFITGWLGNSGKIYGRPVDLKFGPDGALYVSDDTAGVIYKIEYSH